MRWVDDNLNFVFLQIFIRLSCVKTRTSTPLKSASHPRMENAVIYVAAVVAGLVLGVCCCLCQKRQKTNTNNASEVIPPPQQQPQHLEHQLSFQQQPRQHPQRQINSVYNEVPISSFSHKIVAQENDPPPSYESVVNLPNLHNRWYLKFSIEFRNLLEWSDINLT